MDTVEFGKALADETRQKIMALCCCRWLNVSDIVEVLDVAQPTVSHHLSILRKAGLVHTQRQGKKVFYTLNQGRLAAACCQVAQDFAPDIQVTVVDEETS